MLSELYDGTRSWVRLDAWCKAADILAFEEAHAQANLNYLAIWNPEELRDMERRFRPPTSVEATLRRAAALFG